MRPESNPVLETRTRHRLTQKALANRLGVAKNYVYLIESGRKPLTRAISQKLAELDNPAPLRYPLTDATTGAAEVREPPPCAGCAARDAEIARLKCHVDLLMQARADLATTKPRK